MKKILLVIIVGFSPVQADDVFFSEWGEGSSSNKYLEIYNGTGADVDLSNYLIMQITNGGNWYENIDTLSGTLVNGDVYVIAHTSADSSILAEADLTESVITNFNGDDARGLIKVVDGDTTVLDYIGSAPEDPGSGWNVAGVTNATKDHTLVRKSTVTSGNTNWATSAGTNETDSEWIVFDQNTWDYVGSHPHPALETTDPAISITSPTDDATLYSSDLTVSFTVSNFNVSTSGGDGHIHYSLDNGTTVMQYTVVDIELTGLAETSHSFIIWLVDDSHTNLDPHVADTVAFTVSQPLSYITIAAARAQGDGASVAVRGVVTTPNLNTATNTEYGLQDGTGGLVIFHNGSPYVTLAVGDSVEVSGTLFDYYGKLEVIPDNADDITVISQNNSLPAFQVVTVPIFVANGEDYESELIRINGVSITSGTWPTINSTNLTISDDGGTSTVTMRIVSAVDIIGNPEPADPFDVQGIVAQYNEDRQILPRYYTDFNPDIIFEEGFEGGSIPENWSVINNDGHPNYWYVYGSSIYAHTGNYSARVYYNPNGSDDWLITPKLDVVSGDSIVFWSKSDIGGIYAEDFNVKVSTTNTEVASFTITLASQTDVPTTWTQYAYSLEPYANQNIYIAIQCVTVNGFYLYVDDFSGPHYESSPIASFSTDSLDFGNTGTGSVSTSFVVSNTGISDLVISSIAVGNSDFSLSASSATVTGGGSETITVTYTPTAIAGDTSYIILTHNGSTSPDSVTVMGAGKSAIYWQDFESWAANLYTAEPQPPGMTQEGNMSYSGDGAANGWEKTMSVSDDFAGVNGSLFDGDEGSYGGADTSALITPAIDFTSSSNNAGTGRLGFYLKKRGTEEFYVAYSSDNGTTWTKGYTTTEEYYGSGSYGWVSVSVEVPIGSTYYFKFVGRANGQSVFSDVFIDEISFVEMGTNVSGVISSNTTWSLANSPYIVTGSVLVNQGVTLTVEAGVVVKFDGDYYFYIDGTLLARGDVENLITFTSNQSSPQKGDWEYIKFRDSAIDASFSGGSYSSGSIMEYCIVEYGDNNRDDNTNEYYTGMIWCYKSAPLIKDVIIRESYGNGLAFTDASGADSLVVLNCTITNNNSIGLTFHQSGKVSIRNCTLTNNNLNIHASRGSIENCTFNSSDIWIHVASADSTREYIRSCIINNSSLKLSANSSYYTITKSKFIGKSGDYTSIDINKGESIYITKCILVSNNTSKGISFDGNADDVSVPVNYIQECNISGFTEYGISIENNNVDISNTTIRGNSIGIFLSNNDDNNDYIESNVENSNFQNNSSYNIKLDNSTVNTDGENNYWGTTSSTEIATLIYDYYEDFDLGIVDYDPYLTVPNTDAPISPPANLVAENVAGGIQLTWDANPESDLAGYKVYYNGYTGYSFTNVVDVGNVTTYTLSGVTTSDTLALTAYDSNADGTDDMVEGNESWYSMFVDTTAPATPTGLTATPGYSMVTLTWTANSESDLASYKVYGGTSSSPTTLLSTVSAGTETYTHSSLTNGTLYYHRISAVDNAGNESDMTQDENATPAYQGPVWYVHSQGSDELGDGSEGLPFATIQNAIDVSNDSDTVYVHAGTYYENINLTKNIVLEGENRETTIIDGGQNGRVVSINGDNIVFQGFTVQNGLGALSNYGGGINADSNNPNSYILVDDCIITDNMDGPNNGGNGGGGIRVDAEGSTYITNSIIKNNYGYYGGGISASGDVIVRNVLLHDNQSVDFGGGIFVYNSAEMSIYNSTIYNNTSLQAGGAQVEGILNIENSIFYSNYITGGGCGGTGDGNQIQTHGNNNQNGDLTVAYSLIQGGESDICNAEGIINWNTGNIDADPQFSDSANNDFTLQYTSPCIDTGNPDLDGDGEDYTTDVDDQDPDSTHMDMGAFYFDQIEFPITYGCMDPGATNYDSLAIIDDGSCYNDGPVFHISTDGNDFFGIGTEQNPYLTIQHGMDVSSDSDTVLVHPGTYVENINYNSKNIVVKGEDRETTIIDGNGVTAVVKIINGESAVLDGFTIANGFNSNSSSLAGGISVANSFPVLKNVIVENNTGTHGAGIRIEYSTAYISNTIVRNNNGAEAGGICSKFSNIYIDSTEVYNNSGYVTGAGILIYETTPNAREASITNSHIHDNTTTYMGGGLHFSNANVLLENVLVENNVSQAEGGGISMGATYHVEIINSTIVDNNSQSDNGENIANVWGVDDDMTLTITNSIIYDSQSDSWGFSPPALPDSNLNISYSFSNNYSDTEGYGIGNLYGDPLFMDVDDYYLQWGSPCIDSGDPDLDGDGDYYTTDENDQDPDGTRMDMGAYYFDQTDLIPPTVTISNLSSTNIGTDDVLTISWEANDNWILDSAFIDLLYSETIIRVDTVMADTGQATIEVPDSSLESFQLIITVWDFLHNESRDTTETISVYDNTPPTVTVLNPQSGYSIPENTELTMTWNATDNISIDSVITVHYSNDSGNVFIEVGEFSVEQEQGSFIIPPGSTNNAQLKLAVEDIYENAGEGFSDYFSVTDNTSPTVTIDTPDNMSIGETVSLTWTASDNTSIEKHKLYYAVNINQTFTLIDSVDGNAISYDWLVPNVVTDSARIRIETYDSVNLSTADTSTYFVIIDEIIPTIEVLVPAEGYTIPEYGDLTTSWTASDNIALDSIRAYYSKDGGTSFNWMGAVSAVDSNYTFTVPFGFTGQAQVKLEAIDIYGNMGEDLSDYFSVSDNTPPEISLLAPTTGTGLDIGYDVQISWSATDNDTVDHVNIEYMTDALPWTVVAQNEVDDGEYEWVVPNTPSSSASLRVLAFDPGARSDTSQVENLSIIITYPVVTQISPSASPLTWHDDEITVIFSQGMDPTTISLSNITIQTNHSGDLSPTLDPANDGRSFTLNFPTGFASLDTVTLTLSAQMTSSFGYQLDGDGNEVPGDDYSFTYDIAMLADYDTTSTIDAIDLATFVQSLDEDDYYNELGPVTGTVPHFITNPDSLMDIEDVMAFVMMWNWYVTNNGGLLRQLADFGEPIDIEATHDSLYFDLPQGVLAYEVQVQHNPEIISFGTVESNSTVKLQSTDKEVGLFNLINAPNEQTHVSIPINISGKEADITFVIRAIGYDNTIISQQTSKITVHNIPEQFALHHNYPNPFNPVTTIQYDIPIDAEVLLVVYDILGRHVKTLINTHQTAGYKSIRWNGTNDYGQSVSAGMYFYHLQTVGYTKVRKMVLLK